jgi:TonB family protein
MHKEKDHTSSWHDYERYLNKQMSDSERFAFEKRLLSDEFESEALEGLEAFDQGEIHADLQHLKKGLSKKTKRTEKLVVWRIAAAVVLLAASSFLVFYLTGIPQRHELADKREIPAVETEPTERLKQPEADRPPPVHEHESAKKPQQHEATRRKNERKQSGGSAYETDTISNRGKSELLADQMPPPMQPTGLPATTYKSETEIKRETMAIQEVAPVRSEEMLEGADFQLDSYDDRKKALSSRMYLQQTKTRTITGTISSVEDDEVLPGANVEVKGASIGTVADVEGHYSITIPADTEQVTLIYRYIGFIPEEVVVTESGEVNVTIEPDINALSEIVVTGYEADKQEDERGYSFLPPRPAGGHVLFKNYVKQYMQYPASATKEAVKGTVKLRFIVTTDGAIRNIEVLKSLGKPFDDEAIRLVLEGPRWQPAEVNGEDVDREVKVKIRFRPPG